MGILYRFFGTKPELYYRKKWDLPTGYNGVYPQPPDIDVAVKNAANTKLLADNAPKGTTFKEKLSFWFFSKLMQYSIQFIGWSCGVAKFDLHPKAKELILDESSQFIIALWHNRLFYGVYPLRYNIAPYRHDVLAIISESNDAEYIARACEAWGAFCARGSSSRGGIKAFKSILKNIRLKYNPLITPDGPRGPVYEAKDGLAIMAQITGLPILPMCYDAKSKWVFRSWDGFIVPKPFTKVVVSYAEPIVIGKDEDIEVAKRRITDHMMAQVNRTADATAEL